MLSFDILSRSYHTVILLCHVSVFIHWGQGQFEKPIRIEWEHFENSPAQQLGVRLLVALVDWIRPSNRLALRTFVSYNVTTATRYCASKSLCWERKYLVIWRCQPREEEKPAGEFVENFQLSFVQAVNRVRTHDRDSRTGHVWYVALKRRAAAWCYRVSFLSACYSIRLTSTCALIWFDFWFLIWFFDLIRYR